MPTISVVIVPAKVLKGGRHKIRISVAHNGETRYILTDVIIDSVKEFKNGQIVKRPDAAFLNTKLRNKLQFVQEAIDNIEYIDGLTCPEVIYLINQYRQSKNATLNSLFMELMDIVVIEESTRRKRKAAWNTIMQLIGVDMNIKAVSLNTITSLDRKMKSRGLKPSSRNNYLANLGYVLNYAKSKGIITVSPLTGYKRAETAPRDSWLTVEEIKKLRDAKLKKKAHNTVRDLVMLSYYLGGINIVDLLRINFKECGGRIKYVRHKTRSNAKINKYVEFDIPEEAKPLIKKMTDESGYIKCSEAGRKTNMSHTLCYNLKKVAEILKLDDLVYYSARKSWSQHAFNLGIPTGVIDYVLGHKVGQTGSALYNYIYVTPEMATVAVRKVLDNLK